jgi:hypothetical protein
MNEPELTCLRCSAIEVDCECKSGFQANPYDRITELEDLDYKRVQSIETLHKSCREYRAQLEAVKPIAVYANNQADMAQIRLLKDDKPLYDDSYWQPVLDRIRFDLLQIKAIGEGATATRHESHTPATGQKR